MKKTLALILSLLFIVSCLCVTVCAEEENPMFVPDSEGILSYTGLDFSADNTVWAKYDETTDTWSDSGIVGRYYTDGETYIYVLDDTVNKTLTVELDGRSVTYTYDEFAADEVFGEYWEDVSETYLTGFTATTQYSKAITWSLSDDREFMTLTSNSSSSKPGLFYSVDSSATAMQVGDETKGYPEYVAIRYRNWSSATVMTLGFVTNNTNVGGAFMTRTTSDLEIVANSGEWVTAIVSMKEINGAMGHTDNNGGDGWTGKLKMFAVFPFGFGKTDGTGAYESASMDIDYIVIGSKDFVTNYKSELQLQEESVTNIELVSAPTKRTYYVGDVVDLEGLQIKATYKDGSSEIITNCSGITYDFTKASDSATVTLKYGSNTTPLTYDVQVIGINNIEITNPAKTTTFLAGEVADGFSSSQIDGLAIKVNYADGTSKEGVVPTVKNISLSATTVGDQIATINYYGAEATYAVKLITVSGITAEVTKETIHYGDTLTTGDLNIVVEYTDGTQKSLADSGMAEQVAAIEADTKTIGDIEFEVKLVNEAYGIDVSTKVKATVAAPASLKITSLPTKVTYDPDQQLDTTGLVVKYVYADGTEVAVDADDYTTRYDFSTPGTKTVTVRSSELSTTFEVTVSGTVATTKTSTQATTKAAETKSGCGSVVGFGSLAILAVVTTAGVAIIKKKED